MPILINALHRYWGQARRIGLMTGAMLMVVAGCLSFALPASANAPCGTHGVLSAVGNVLTCTYTTSGEDTFNAPLFVTDVHVVAVGQTGGTSSAEECLFSTGDGGSGARVAADLPVTQPTLFVEIPTSIPLPPGGPGCGGGGGGGGGEGPAPGGGASEVQTCSVNPFTCLLTGKPQTDPRLVVAGGGGGGAFKNVNGGNAGAGANPMCNPGQSGQGAPMWAVAGGGGFGGGCNSVGSGGHGGSALGTLASGQTGDHGSIPTGGNGGAPAVDPIAQDCTYAHAWNGAGGGSGFFGGGGGGGAAYCNGGGGGGGSSFAGPSATNVSMTLAPQNAPATVTISWVQPVNREYQFLTGRAVGLAFTQSAPNPTPVTVTDVDTGAVQTSMTQTVSPPCQTSLIAPVGGGTGTTLSYIHACAEVVTTGGNQLVSKSMAGATVRGLALRIPGLPVVKALTVISGSKTTCAGSTGATYIAYLAVGSDVLISHPQVVAPNTHFTVGQISVSVNVQAPFTTATDRGLIVDGIVVSVGPPSSVTAGLVVASAESDIGDCPGQQHVN